MIVKICGLAMIGVCAYSVLSQLRSGVSFALRMALAILMGAFAVLLIAPIPEKISELAAAANVKSEYITPLIRSVGVAVLGQLTADVCRDCGEGSAASGVELAAKLEIVLICLPLIETVTEYAFTILAI